MSCQANVVSDKVGLPQWASPYSLNIESGLARSLLRLLGRPDRLTLDSELVPQPGLRPAATPPGKFSSTLPTQIGLAQKTLTG